MDNQDSCDIDWAAIVDLFASEYGWTIEYIKSLDLGQIVSLKAKMKIRYDQQNSQPSEDMGAVPGEDGISIADFEKMGKKVVREDGTTEIII